MKISELLRHIDLFSGFSLAEEWDNSGLLLGSPEAECVRVGVSLDAVSESVLAASEEGCNVLVCHHPLIFRAVKRITDETEQGRTILEAVRRGVNIIAAHTNWDKARGGVNDTLAGLLGLREVEPLDAESGLGVVGVIEGLGLEEFLLRVKSSWGLSHIDAYGGAERVVRVALCGGSGSEFWGLAKSRGADIYLTADMKYHELIDATREGLTIGLINHGEMERATLPELARKISLCGVETVILDVKALTGPLRI
ncbi:MAG: Nif3-like dinuclear metal center hexameric protein [Synergistaceae bacterium]|nr:Nif3-like dinuclear metal center hexameric protein [Synergistaceae bacterium]